MKVVLLSLLPLLASASNSRKLVSRYLEENPELVEAFDMDMGDWTCIMKGAASEDECITGEGDCSWCPLGTSGFGACVSVDQGEAINDAGFPHMSCGKEPTLGDDQFWDGFISCEMASVTEDQCLGTPFGCTWCVVNDPVEFALCMSKDFMDEIEALEDPDEPVKIEDVMDCSTSSRNSETEGLLDFSCVMFGAFGKGACEGNHDESGNLCVWDTTFEEDFGGLCMTPTQKNLMDWIINTLDDFGIDIQQVLEDPSSLLDVDVDIDVEGMEGGETDYGMVQQYNEETNEEEMYESVEAYEVTMEESEEYSEEEEYEESDEEEYEESEAEEYEESEEEEYEDSEEDEFDSEEEDSIPNIEYSTVVSKLETKERVDEYGGH